MTSKGDRLDCVDGETGAPFVDALEVGVLVATPTLGMATVAAIAGGEPLVGLVFGAVVGSFLGTIRRSMIAVRTPEGIVRRPRPVGGDGEPGWPDRLADIGGSPRVDLLVAFACGVVGLGALAGLVLFADDAATALRLAALALFGLVCSLGAMGTYFLQ